MSRQPDHAVYAAMQRENRRRSRSALITVFVVIPAVVVAILCIVKVVIWATGGDPV